MLAVAFSMDFIGKDPLNTDLTHVIFRTNPKMHEVDQNISRFLCRNAHEQAAIHDKLHLSHCRCFWASFRWNLHPGQSSEPLLLHPKNYLYHHI
jgi:hypothetical protein